MLFSKSKKKLYVKRIPFLFNERFLLEVFKKIQTSRVLKSSSLLSLRLKLKGQTKLKKKQKKYSWLAFFVKLKKSLAIRVPNHTLISNLQLSNNLNQSNIIVNLEKSVDFYSVRKTPIIFSLKKNHCTFIWKTQPQFFFYFKDLCNNLFSTRSFLLEELFTSYNTKTKYINSSVSHFFKASLVSNLYKTKSSYSFGNKTTFINASYFISLQKLLYLFYFIFLAAHFSKSNTKTTFLVRKFIFFLFNSLNFELSSWEASNISKILSSYHLKTMFLDTIAKKEKKIGALFLRRSSVLLNTNLLGVFSFKSPSLTKASKVLSLKNYIWKYQNNFFVKRSFDPEVKLKKVFKTKFKTSRKKSSSQIVYLLGRIDRKLELLNSIELTPNQQELKTKLISLQLLLSNLLAEKKTRAIQQNMIFSSWESIRKVRSILHVFPRNFQKNLDSVTKNPNYLEDFKYRSFIIYVLKKYISLKKILNLFISKNKEKIIKLDEFGFNFREYTQSKLKLQKRILNSLSLLKKHKKWKQIINKKQCKSKKRILQQLKKKNRKINLKELNSEFIKKRNLNLTNNKIILNNIKKILKKKFNNNKKVNIFRRKWITKHYFRKIFWFLSEKDFIKGWAFIKRNNWNGKQYTRWFRRLTPWTQRMLKYITKLRLQRKFGAFKCKRWDRTKILFTKTPSVKFRFIYFRPRKQSKVKYPNFKISEKIKLRLNKKRKPLFLKKGVKEVADSKFKSFFKMDTLSPKKLSLIDSQKKYLLLKQKRYFLIKQTRYLRKKNETNQKQRLVTYKKTSFFKNKKQKINGKSNINLKEKHKFKTRLGFWRKSRWTWYKMTEQKGNRRPKRTLIGIRPIIAGKYTSFIEKKLLLSTWLGFPINLFFINTLSLTKFSLKLDRIQLHKRQASPNKIFAMFERDYINRYKYIAIYIKDFIRIGLISVFFKKPSFLAKFTAFQLAKLPRNRKETVFIRFLMKAIRTFARGRKEMLAVRIKFKGRVNRWRRTKFIMKSSGTFPFQTIAERIEEGTAQAVNRKGAVGIHIWLRYKPNFMLKMQDHLLNYMRYSKIIKYNRLKKQILLK